MEVPTSLNTAVVASKDDASSTQGGQDSPRKSHDDSGRSPDSEPSENMKDSNPSYVDTEKPADLEANVVETLSALNSSRQLEKSNGIIDSNIVDWDGPDDPSNPMNWPPWKVKAHIFLVSSITFIR